MTPFGVPQQFGVTLGSALVEALDRVVFARSPAQSRDESAPAALAAKPTNGMVRRIRPCGSGLC